MTMPRDRSYSELARLRTFDERFEYLKLSGDVGRATFGFDRYINQKFYASSQWRWARRQVILRDDGCDLGIPGIEIPSMPLIHHINPMSPDDIIHGEDWICDPEFLITTSHMTHNAIHFGDRSLIVTEFVERKPGDTRLW